MQNETSNIQEVAQPLSQGEKNFKAMHKVALNKSTVPGVTDQEHVFKGNPRKLDQPTASREIYKSEDESKENYDKGLKRKEDYYATEEVEEVPSFEGLAKLASMRFGSDEASKKVSENVLNRLLTSEETEEVEEIVEPIVEKKVAFKGYKAKHDPVGKEDSDIDNDGDSDESDSYLHNRRKAIKAAMKEEAELEEKTLTDAEMKKREEVVKAIKRENPKMDKSMAYAIATKTAKRVAEASELGPESKIKDNKHANSSDYISKNSKFANKGTAAVKKMVSHDCAKHVAHEEWGFGVCIPECHTIVETAEGQGYVTHYDIEFAHGIELNVPVENLHVLVSESHGHAARKSMKEDYDMDVDYEGEMARAELRAICDKADKLANMMSDDMQLEAWLQSKISRAKDYIDAVYDYLNYREPVKDAMPEVPMATQAPMATNYASFLNRMGEETSAINKAKKAFESKLVELGLEPAPKVVVESVSEVKEEEHLDLSDEEKARIKEILEKE